MKTVTYETMQEALVALLTGPNAALKTVYRTVTGKYAIRWIKGVK